MSQCINGICITNCVLIHNIIDTEICTTLELNCTHGGVFD